VCGGDSGANPIRALVRPRASRLALPFVCARSLLALLNNDRELLQHAIALNHVMMMETVVEGGGGGGRQ
jgi:hypothetical protein